MPITSIKSERLERRIQEIQQFVNDRIEREPIFAAVSQELPNIADTLKQGKLTVQIVSDNRVLAQNLQNFLHNYDPLKEAYRFSPILQISKLNSTNDTSANSQLAECNILCLVIAPNQMHEIDEMQLIEKISKTPISTLVVVVEMSDVASESALQANTIKDEVSGWLQTHSNIAQKEVYSTSQSDIEMFCRSLGTLNKRKAEDIFIKQLNARVLTQLTLIEKFLIKQHRELEIEHQQAQASLSKVGGDQIRIFDETIRLINNDKASVIREIKSSVNKSETDLLDRFLDNSIIGQLHSKVYALESEIVKQKEGHIYIRLVKKIKTVNKYYVKNKEISNNYTERSTKKLHQINKKIKLTTNSLLRSYFRQSLLSKLIKFKSQPQYRIALVKEGSVDANTVLTDYYRNTLSEWAAREWKKVCNTYAKGGLFKLFQRTYERLKSFPYLNIESSDWEPSQYIDIKHFFVKPIKTTNFETSYRKISLLGFIFGRIRSNLMPFLSIGFLLSILGIASKRQIARWFFQPIYSAIETAPFPTIIILLLVIYFLLKALFETYEKHNLAEMKKAEVKLKDEIYDFYSKLIQHLTDKVRLEILSVIETKEEWMDENLKDYKQLLDQKNEAAEDNEPLNKKLIEQQREHLRRLNQELGDIRRMQRI